MTVLPVITDNTTRAMLLIVMPANWVQQAVLSVCCCLTSHCSEAADYLLQGISLAIQGFKGVCYYDGLLHKGWVVKDLVGRVMPRHSSPIAEREVRRC
jgi:hypothetical protein